MEWFIAAIAVVVLGLAALAAAGRLGAMPEPVDDVYAPTLPDGDLTPDDLRHARFGVAMRGYDMRQVDALLRRLADQLDGVERRERSALLAPGEASDEDVAGGADSREARQPVGAVWNTGSSTDDEK